MTTPPFPPSEDSVTKRLDQLESQMIALTSLAAELYIRVDVVEQAVNDQDRTNT